MKDLKSRRSSVLQKYFIIIKIWEYNDWIKPADFAHFLYKGLSGNNLYICNFLNLSHDPDRKKI